MNTSTTQTWKISVDTGGTFTDCLAVDPDGNTSRVKVLSSSRLRGRIIKQIDNQTFEFEAPWKYPGKVLEGYSFICSGYALAILIFIDHEQKVLRIDSAQQITPGTDFELNAGEEAPVLAARLLTNTSLKQPLPPIEMRLGTTKGTNALLERKGAKTLLIVTKGFKDLLYIGNQQRPSLFQLNIPEPKLLHASVIEVDERVDSNGKILAILDTTNIADFEELNSYQSVAISLLHSGENSAHETEIEELLIQKGKKYISASARLFPFSHYLRRTQTAVVNAYLDPVLDAYLQNIAGSLSGGNLRIMTSTGSLSEISGFRAKDSLLSGPAGGIVAAANTAKQFGFSKVLTFDMGGTSTDTARIDGEPELKYITEIDGIEFHNPTLAIETVAAGGGSVCWFDGFSLQVGPESAGASPGPACYGAGGPLTITDVNLLLGKLDPARFGIPIRSESTVSALKNLQNSVSDQTGNLLSENEILTGLERIANEKMADAIRKISVEKGINPAEYALITFGGAGGLHSCQLADLLDIKHVIIPYDAGLFSAVGIGQALVSTIVSRQILETWVIAQDSIERIKVDLFKQASAMLSNQGVDAYEVAFCSIFLRFVGQENTIEIPYTGQQTLAEFKNRYTSLFGYFPEKAVVEIESLRMKVREKASPNNAQSLTSTGSTAISKRQVFPIFSNDNKKNVPNLFDWDELSAHNEISGPAILLNNTSTAYIPEGWRLVIQENLDAVVFKTEKILQREKTTQSEEVAFQLFTNRFKAIAEEMGIQLQRTAFSVNVKERLDFSCALLDADGELLVNAQHIPVHLGSMGICGRLVKEAISIGPGDVIITNHPKYGGSHLPDITLISGVFTDTNECIGYVINRAHHAEIGGKTPGSMPPDAVCLAEEGVVILPQYLVKKGIFQRDSIQQLFTSGPYPTRSYESNEADILAALSALRKGTEQLLHLVKAHGLEPVKYYMNLLKETAVHQLNQALKPFEKQTFDAAELLDDGHQISVKISIQPEKQIFDFTGTSPVHPNNLNANISILHSAILYVLRILVNKEVPLNDGLMKNVVIILPDNSFLHPNFSDDPLKCPAVVGGNTEVSQRLVDTLLKAFGLAGCSQGTMNNFLFGNKNFGYYETIGGGVGAGEGFNGRSAVHQHMTNTRITDPEQLERKYPVRLLEFGIRKNSGGCGEFKGGDGIIRKLQFLEPLQVTLLGQHRRVAPYGLNGGEEGKCGNHTLISNSVMTDLPGICNLEVQEGAILTIETPGGGGFGRK